LSKSDRTYIGGEDDAFRTTEWHNIHAAQTVDPQRRARVVGAIMGKYWKPVYAYLRRHGKNNEEAKDLTQGFFHEIVLGRELISHADEHKGRFRTLLLTSLDRYVISIHRAKTARKRMPGQVPLALGSFDPDKIAGPIDFASPADAFTYTWASELIGNVIDEVKSSCLYDGLEKHWSVFLATVIKPTMEGAEAPSLAQLCNELDIASEAKA